MKWIKPQPIKVYEALGTVADGRVHMAIVGRTARVYSSSGNKFYEVEYDPEAMAIMSNDNSSYWTGQLGYPSIAFLFSAGYLEYKPHLANLLKGIMWKDINQKFKNDFNKTLEYIETLLGDNRDKLREYVQDINSEIAKMDLSLLGGKRLPPEGY